MRTFHGSSSTVSIQVRIQPDLGRLVAGALELVELLHGSLVHGLGQVRRLDAGAQVLLLGVGAAAVEVTQLLLHRRQLLAQQELTLLLVHALLDVLADRLGDIELGQVLAGELDHQLEALTHIDGLQQRELLLGREVRRVAGGVGQQRRVADPRDRSRRTGTRPAGAGST